MNKQALTIVQLRPDLQFPMAMLKTMLPDVETALFFAQIYRLNADELGTLLSQLFHSPVIEALTGEGGLHSDMLQDYLVDIGYQPYIQAGDIVFGEKQPQGEILPELWEANKVEIAKSIQQVAEKLKDVVAKLPGKHGEMIFRSMQVMNSKRPTIGDHKAHVHHAPQLPNLVILDVSGSMSERTIKTIVEDVVALSWEANAHLAIVSNTCTHWRPGEYSIMAVLNAAEYGGTHYEELAPLFKDMDWGVVITIADYDSSYSAKPVIAATNGTIDTVLDISLVSQPTFLAEVVGQKAQDVRPLLIAAPHTDLTY
jgi:hypothetical protein